MVNVGIFNHFGELLKMDLAQFYLLACCNQFQNNWPKHVLPFSIYCLVLAFEHYRQVYIVQCGLQDESLHVTIS